MPCEISFTRRAVYSLFIACFLCLGAHSVEAANMSGAYTVNKNAPASSANYTSFSTLAAALAANTVVGAVTINVVAGSGPYNEQLVLGVINGASATNTITINGNGNTLQYTPQSSTTHTGILVLGGTKYVKVDNLIFKRLNNTSFPSYDCHGAYLHSACAHDTISNCTFDFTTYAYTGFALQNNFLRIANGSNGGISATLSGATNTYVGGCQFLGAAGAGNLGPYGGFYCYGPNTGNVYANNFISGAYNTDVSDTYGDNITYSHNTATKQNRSTVFPGAGGYRFQYTTGTSKIISNKAMYLAGASINPATSNTPFTFANLSGTVATSILIANNVACKMTAPISYGIYINGSQYVDVYNNTIADEVVGTGSGVFNGIRLETSSTGVNIKNNLISATGGNAALKHGLYYLNSVPASSDYNNVYMNSPAQGNQYFGKINNTGFGNNPADFQGIGLDVHSNQLNPLYTDAAAANLQPGNPALNDKGVVLASVTEDINSTPRGTPPDIGAYEFTTPSCTPLSGSYTINSAQPMDLTTGNFRSFDEVTAIISQCGMAGAVMLNVTPGSGPYNEYLELKGSNLPTTSVNTLTINGNGVTVQAEALSNHSALMQLDGVSYVKIDSFIFKSIGSGATTGAYLVNGCDNDSITRCIFDMASMASQYAGTLNPAGIDVDGTATLSAATNTYIGNCKVIGSSSSFGIDYGLRSEGPNTGNVYHNNVIANFYERGIIDMNGNGVTYSNNTITREGKTINPLAEPAVYGIYSSGSGGATRFVSNRVEYLGGATDNGTSCTPFYFNNLAGVLANPTLIANNVAANMTSSPDYGIFIGGTGKYTNVYNNTVSIDKPLSYQGNNYGIYINTSQTGINIKNNLVTITGGAMAGDKYGLYYQALNANAVSDYNNVYINSTQSGNQYFGYRNGSHATLGAFQAASGLDANSHIFNPVYSDPATGNFTPMAAALDNMGISVAPIVTDDINGNTRNASTPDIGAYEFTISPCTDPPTAGNATASKTDICLGGSVTIGLTAYTTGAAQSYQWQSAPAPSGSWVNEGGVALSPEYTVTPPSSGIIYYRCLVTCGTHTGASAPVAISVATPLPAGVYTINSAQPTGGSNFQTFTEAVAAVSCGMSGNVTFTVAPASGPYNEQVVIGDINNGATGYTATFNGNGATVQYGATATYTGILMMSGTKHVKFDSLTFKSLSNTYGFGAILSNGCEHDSLTRCVFDLAGINSSNAVGRETRSGGLRITAFPASESNTISGAANCYIGGCRFLGETGSNGMYYGMYCYGPNAGNVYYNNLISDFYYTGIYDNSGDDITYDGNTITRQTKTATAAIAPYGIFAVSTKGASRFTANKIAFLGGATDNNSYACNPFYFSGLSGSLATHVLIANNQVANLTANPNYGININGGFYADVYNNTIHIGGTFTRAEENRSIYLSGSVSTHNVKNNIVTITGGGTSAKYGLYYANLPAGSDNNNVYFNSSQAGSQNYGYYGSAKATLSDFRIATGKDANSKTLDPVYVNAGTDLTPTNPLLDDKGTPDAGVATDINGASRSAATPDIGAYEFTGTSNYTWTGNANDGNWNTGGNWSGGVKPGAGQVAIIPDTVNMPTIFPIGTITVGSLIIRPSAQITLPANRVLAVNDVFVNNGVIAGAGKVALSGTAAQELSGNGTVENLELSNSAGALIAAGNAHKLNITGLLSLTNGTLTTNNNLVLKSTSPTTTAMVGPITGGIIGNVTHERYLSAPANASSGRSWRLLTSPIANNSAGNSIFYHWQNNGLADGSTGIELFSPSGTGAAGNGLAMGGNSASIRSYNAANNAYVSVTNTKTTNLFTGTGNNAFLAFVSGSYGSGNIGSGSGITNVHATGALITGTQTYSFTPPNSSNIYELIGNPYSCPIDFDKVYANAGTSNINQKFWVIDPNLGSIGAYVTISNVAGSYVANVPSNQNRYIQTGQAFFVEGNNAGNISTVAIEEDDKETGAAQTAVFRTNGGNLETFRINLYKDNNGAPLLLDGTVAACHENCSNAINGTDAEKFTNFNESVSIYKDGGKFAIEARELLDNNDTLHVALANMQQAAYTLELEPDNMSASGLTAMLIDHFTNTATLVSLSGNTFYTFSVTSNAASTGTNRFEVVFNGGTPLALKFLKMSAERKEQKVRVAWSVGHEEGTRVYEVEKSGDGKTFEKTGTVAASGAGAYSFDDEQPYSGANYYRVKAVARSTSGVYSNIVRVIMNEETRPTLASYPNPVEGGMLNVNLSNLKKGAYFLNLYNAAGQKVAVRQIRYDGGSETVNIAIASFATGVYMVQLMNEQGEAIAEQKTIRK